MDELKREIENIPVEITALEEELRQEESRREDIVQELKTLRVAKKEKEIELQSKEDEIKKHNAELMKIKSNEAYAALIKEINASKKIKEDMENELLEIMEKEENLVTGQENHSAVMETKRKEAEQKKRELHDKLDNMNKTLAELKIKREEKAKEIPSTALGNYHYLRNANLGVVVVPVENGYCGGCNVGLSPQALSNVMADKDFVVCNTCSRILYMEEKEAQ